MTSVLDEIRRIQSAKTDIEEAIEYCGVNIPDTALIDTYASYIKSIPDTLFTTLNYDQIGGDDFYIKTIKQSNGLINATTGGCVSSTSSGLAPKIGTSAASTISAQDNEWVLTSTQGGSPTWRKLPNNAFENDNTNTTYALSGALSANTYITTLTDSASGKTTATIPAMSGASSTAAGTAGLVPAPAANKHTAFLRGDGTWVVPTNYYRPISVNGTSILENNNTALNLVAGANISITAENSSGYTGKVTITNTGVHSTTINGNYLRVNTNGTNTDLTIPYATTASQLNNTSVSDPSKAASDQNVKWYSQISGSSGYAGTNYGFPVSNNANGILWLGTHYGTYGWQMGFSSNGRIYARCISNNSFSTTANGGSWNRIAWTTDITKSQVGLGNVQNTAFYQRQTTVNGTVWNMAGTTNGAAFTIYAPTTAGSSGQVLTSTAGTPGWTNQSSLSVGYATSAGSVAWGNITGKPSTFTPSSHNHSQVLDISSSSATTFAYSKAGLNYGDYTWLAGWNGYELRAVNKNQFAQASHTHSYITSGGRLTCGTTTARATGLRLYEIYHNGYPFTYGNVIQFNGASGVGQLACQWHGTGLAYRSAPDTSTTFTGWATILTSTNSSVSGGGSSGGSSITVNIGGTSKTLTIPTSLPANGGNAASATYATSAGTASKVTCTEASGDTPRPIVGTNLSNQLYYNSKVTIRWDNGNVTAPTFTGRLIGSADQVNGHSIWTGTQAQYNAAPKNNNTIYLIY